MPFIVHDGTGCWINSNFPGQRYYAASSKTFFYTGLYSSGLIKVVAHFEERCHLKCVASDDPSLMLE
jgi:hypothetical protein